MPTVRPRLSITLTEPLHLVLSRFADLTDQSMSSLIVQFLDHAAPQLERITVMLQAAKDATPEALAQVKRTLDQAEAVLQSHQGALMTSMDLFTRPLMKNAPEALPSALNAAPGPVAGRTRAKLSAKPAVNPPSPNRGGSSTKSTPSPTPKKSSKVVQLRDRRGRK